MTVKGSALLTYHYSLYNAEYLDTLELNSNLTTLLFSLKLPLTFDLDYVLC